MYKNILLTSALPYSNGVLHMGHTLEFILVDIFSRYNKYFINNSLYISGDDCHGTPIMLKASQTGLSVEYLINYYNYYHLNDLVKLNIKFDNFYFTHSYENEFCARRIFNFLNLNKFIYKKKIFQFFDENKNLFLPDRYIIGSCPKCKSNDQYGDVCEKCSYKYDAMELINPLSILSNTSPIKKSSVHYFFDLNKFNFFLKNWCLSLSQKFVYNKLLDWFDFGLKSWDISRDFPYFGFRIPNDYYKYFYVWLDAPIGYISILYNFSLFNNLNLELFFGKKSIFHLIHFIGKDISYFHTLFWPAILHACELRLPNDIFIHGFLTINNRKMSKSTGNFLILNKFLNNFESDYIRYYFASKLNDNINDLDFNLHEFINKINSDLISNFINIGSRCINIIAKHYDLTLSNKISENYLFYEYLSLNVVIKRFYEERSYSKIISIVMTYASYINIYLDREKPWILLRHNNTLDRAHNVCTIALNLFIILLFYLKPILPNLYDRFEYILKLNSLDSVKTPLVGIKINNYIHVYKKINIENKDIF